MLSAPDHQALAERWIDTYWAEAAGIERVDRFRGAELVGGDPRKYDFSGLWIPYRFPEDMLVAEHLAGRTYTGRVRRDHPEIQQARDGTRKPKRKYVAAPGDRNRLYFPPYVRGSQLADTELPIIMTEGEFKTLALRRLASWRMPSNNGTGTIRFLPVGLAGVWNWQGKIGHMPDQDGQNVTVEGPIPDLNFLQYLKRRIVIAFDANDVKHNPNVKAARHRLAEHLMSLGASVGFLEWDVKKNGKDAKGIDDWLARDGPDPVLEAIASVEFRDALHWQSRLLRTDNGKIKALLENGRLAFAESEEWRGNLIRDSFLGRLVCNRRPWSQTSGIWRDEDSMYAACWLQKNGIEIGQDLAYSAAITAAHVTDCAAEWLERQEWDGEPRIDDWLPRYLRVATRKDGRDIANYVSAVGTAWLIGGVARLLEPGCQMDYTLVLCGPEGQGKSTALRFLGRNEWFTDSIKDISNVDAFIQLQGVWIVEFAELEAWRRAGDWKNLRAFLTARVDHFRGKYARFAEAHSRRCIFAGTTNEEWFLEGGTEGRRFWPVLCTGPARLADLERDVVQLWAEAKERWLSGARPYLSDPGLVAAASEEREAYKQEDPWFNFIDDWCKSQAGPITVAQVLKEAIGEERQKMGRIDQQRVIACLRTLGYESCYIGGSQRHRGWTRE